MSASPNDSLSSSVDLLLNLRNPFAGGIAGNPWDDPRLDVPDIHQEAYAQCLRVVREVREGGSSSSLLLFGDAGTGKTHLLGRLRRSLEAQPISERPLFAVVELATSPNLIWRHLRRKIASDLLRPAPGGSPRLQVLLKERANLIHSVEDASLSNVLEALRQGAHTHTAQAWLRGDPLSEAALHRLDLPSSGSEEESLEDQSQRITLELCRLLAPTPIVLCLDQMESLKRFAGDDAGLRALGRAVTTLFNGTNNLAIICCTQSVFMRDLETTISAADMDRMGGQNVRSLRPLFLAEAERLVAGFLDLDPALAKLRRTQSDRLWPLETEKLRQLFGQEDVCTARKVIYACKGWFEESRGRKPEEAIPLDQMLAAQFRRELAEASALGIEDSEAIMLNGLPLLFRLWDSDISTADADGQREFTFTFRDSEGLAAVCIFQDSGNPLTSRLKRLAADWNSVAIPRLFIVRDARLGLPSSARVAHTRLRELRDSGARLVEISPQALAALKAAHALSSSAASGNLSHMAESVPLGAVHRWLIANPPDAFQELKDQFYGKNTAQAPDCLPQLADLLRERKILSVEEAASVLNRPPEEVMSCARTHPSRFGLLGGVEKILFAVATQAEEGVVA